LCVLAGSGSGSAQGDTGPPPTPPATAPPAPAAPSVADIAATKADPNCQPAAVECTWAHCYPLDPKFTSYSACIATNCQMKDKECVMDLISDLYDPDREKNKGTR
jgi:hypothetical protein